MRLCKNTYYFARLSCGPGGISSPAFACADSNSECLIGFVDPLSSKFCITADHNTAESLVNNFGIVTLKPSFEYRILPFVCRRCEAACRQDDACVIEGRDIAHASRCSLARSKADGHLVTAHDYFTRVIKAEYIVAVAAYKV